MSAYATTVQMFQVLCIAWKKMESFNVQAVQSTSNAVWMWLLLVSGSSIAPLFQDYHIDGQSHLHVVCIKGAKDPLRLKSAQEDLVIDRSDLHFQGFLDVHIRFAFWTLPR